MSDVLLWQWRVRTAPGERWRLVAWRMRPDDARVWAERNRYEIERVPGSASGLSAPVAYHGPTATA